MDNSQQNFIQKSVQIGTGQAVSHEPPSSVRHKIKIFKHL